MTNLKVATCTTITANNWSTAWSGAAEYKVPTGKQFRVVAVKMQESDILTDRCKIGYDSTGGRNDTPTNPDIGGYWGAPTGDALTTTRGKLNSGPNKGANGGEAYGEHYLGESGFVIPADQYPFCSCADATNTSLITFYGYEETP